MQESLLKLMDDLQSLKGNQQEKKEPAAQIPAAGIRSYSIRRNEDELDEAKLIVMIMIFPNIILREKLLNVHRLITKSLNNNPTPDFVFKSPSSFPIPVVDSNSFFEESDTSLSHLDNSLPEFETFSDHTEETRSGITTTHANNALPSRIDSPNGDFLKTSLSDVFVPVHTSFPTFLGISFGEIDILKICDPDTSLCEVSKAWSLSRKVGMCRGQKSLHGMISPLNSLSEVERKAEKWCRKVLVWLSGKVGDDEIITYLGHFSYRMLLVYDP
ncbi:hypothetical protein Tco_0594770 [Tanacetum coccineum]